MNLSNLSGLWTRYLELTGDTEFLISSVVLCLGIIIFLFLLSKLAKTKTVPIGTQPAFQTAAPPVFETPAPPTFSTPAPSAEPFPAPVTMLGTGYDAKPIVKAAPKPPEPMASPAPSPKPADPVSTTRLDVTEKTMVLPPSELPNVKTPPPADVGMFEVLVRRVASVEGELKKDPLYLDPLMKRVAKLEKSMEGLAALSARIDELAHKAAEASPAGGQGEPPALPTDLIRQGDLAPLLAQIAELAQKVEQAPGGAVSGMASTDGGISQEEFIALKEKVTGLQKILELLAEGTSPPQ